MLRVVFAGTAPFAVPCLQAVLQAGHRVAAVVTQPDRQRGRGKQVRGTAVGEAAAALGLPVLQPEKASDPAFVQALRELQPEVLVVVAYGQILKPAVLEIPKLGCINVHGSLLPDLRGAAPIQRTILNGANRAGVCTQFMDVGMDTGDVILSAEEPVYPEDTAGELTERLAPLGARILVETLARVEAGDAPRHPQNHSLATLAPRLLREDGALDWKLPAVELRNRIHACNPAPGAFAARQGRLVKIWRARVADQTTESAPGTVLGLDPLTVATGSGGALELLELQPESRPRCSGPDFCRGQRVEIGELWENGTLPPTPVP